MTQQELYTLLKAVGYPVAFYSFSSPPQLPYLVYLPVSSADFVADNENHVDITNWQVELYTAVSMPTGDILAAEKKIENVLKSAGLPYGRLFARVDGEQMYQTLYTIQTIGGR